jgi:DNA-binding transcriptional ArsR family regulator
MIQLAGFHVWAQTPTVKNISKEDVKRGLICAKGDMERMILDTTVKELSENDMAFLMAMLPDKRISKTSDIISRTGMSSAAASRYRSRLMEQGIITDMGRGRLSFDMPLVKEYLTSHKDEFFVS